MPATLACTPCCSTVQTTNIPGEEGPDGSDGSNGVNAYGIVTTDFIVPSIGDNVMVALDNGIWMVAGQNVVFDGPATFQVVTVNSATSVTLKFLGYALDVAAGTTIPAGAGVSPAGTQPALTSLTVYASGTGSNLTSSQAAVTFTVTSPSLTLTSPGTWLLHGRLRIDNGNTFATVAGETATAKLRRTNNTAADVTAASAAWEVPAIVSNGGSLCIITIPPVIYTTANSDDAIAIFAGLSAIANAGAYVPIEAEIVAVKIS